MFALQKEEVNVGRQKELDLVKGFLMVMIVFIHSYQTIANATAAHSALYKIMFTFFMPTGACLFLFTMGFGSLYSRHNTPKDLVKSGLKLLFFQALSNACYGLSIFLSYSLHNVIWGKVESSVEAYNQNMYSMLTFINIFFISGMCYLVLALYKAIKMPLMGYGISAVLVGIISPFTGKLVSDNYWINWLLDVTFGGKGEATFCFFPYLSFVFAGYIFATVLRRVKENEKGEFYKTVGLASFGIALGWLLVVLITHFGLDPFYEYMHEQYHIPGIAKVIGSVAVIMIFFAVAYFISPVLEKCKFIYERLTKYSRHISKMYAVHIGVYMTVCGFTAFCGFGTVACLGWSVLVLIVTDLLVSGYVLMENKAKNKKSE